MKMIQDIIFQVEQQKQLFQDMTLNTSDTCECRIAGFKTINKKKVPYLAWLPSLHSQSKLSKGSKDDFDQIQQLYKNENSVLLKSSIILSNEQVDALINILIQSQTRGSQVQNTLEDQGPKLLSQQNSQQVEIIENSQTINKPEQARAQIQQENIDSEIIQNNVLSNNNFEKQENQFQQQSSQIQIALNSADEAAILLKQNKVNKQNEQEQSNINFMDNSINIEQNNCQNNKQLTQNEKFDVNKSFENKSQQKNNQKEMENNNIDKDNFLKFNQVDQELENQHKNCNIFEQQIQEKQVNGQLAIQQLINYHNNQFLRSYDQWLNLANFHQIVTNSNSNNNQMKIQEKPVGRWNKKNKKNRQKQQEKSKLQKNNNQKFNVIQEENDSMQKQEQN